MEDLDYFRNYLGDKVVEVPDDPIVEENTVADSIDLNYIKKYL